MINPQILTPCSQLIRYIFVVFNARNTEISHIHLEKIKCKMFIKIKSQNLNLKLREFMSCLKQSEKIRSLITLPNPFSYISIYVRNMRKGDS
jgi:hypothetical protein